MLVKLTSPLLETLTSIHPITIFCPFPRSKVTSNLVSVPLGKLLTWIVPSAFRVTLAVLAEVEPLLVVTGG